MSSSSSSSSGAAANDDAGKLLEGRRRCLLCGRIVGGGKHGMYLHLTDDHDREAVVAKVSTPIKRLGGR